MAWYKFEDDTKTKIVGEYARNQDKLDLEKLEETDPRVQEWIGPEWSRPAYQEYEITSIEDLLVASNMCSFSTPQWGFRGQPNYGRELEHALERNVNSEQRKEFGLSKYERRVLVEAQRRAHLYYDKLPSENDILGWYSFLRHQGVPTRLLDITWSIYVACYFATASNEDKDGALWAFSSFNLNKYLHTHMLQNMETMFYGPNDGIFIDGYQGPTVDSPNATPETIEGKEIAFRWREMIPKIFDLSTRGSFHIKAIMFAEPVWLSKRQDAQQGAFIFPLNCRCNIHENLKSLLGLEKFEHKKPDEIETIRSAKDFINKITNHAAVIKFKIPKEKKGSIRYHLEKMNIRKSVLFPDNDGFVGLLNDLVPKM